MAAATCESKGVGVVPLLILAELMQRLRSWKLQLPGVIARGHITFPLQGAVTLSVCGSKGLTSQALGVS